MVAWRQTWQVIGWLTAIANGLWPRVATAESATTVPSGLLASNRKVLLWGDFKLCFILVSWRTWRTWTILNSSGCDQAYAPLHSQLQLVPWAAVAWTGFVFFLKYNMYEFYEMLWCLKRLPFFEYNRRSLGFHDVLSPGNGELVGLSGTTRFTTSSNQRHCSGDVPMWNSWQKVLNLHSGCPACLDSRTCAAVVWVHGHDVFATSSGTTLSGNLDKAW